MILENNNQIKIRDVETSSVEVEIDVPTQPTPSKIDSLSS
jgi:hypothetical protein